MGDLIIEKCIKGDSKGIVEVAKANNYFNPSYHDHKELGFTGTVFKKGVVEKVINQGYSFKMSIDGKIIGYFLGINPDGFGEAFGERFEGLSEMFFGKSGVINGGKMIYAPQAAIHPDFKGRGFARELFGEVREAYEQMGFESIFAEMLSNNKASISFWGLMGFERIAGRKMKNVAVFKGYDKNWIEANYSKLKDNKDERVDEEFLDSLSCGLYRCVVKKF